MLGEAPAPGGGGFPRHLGDGDSEALPVDGLGPGWALGNIASPRRRARPGMAGRPLHREAF